MATFTLFDEFLFNLGAGNIDLDSHTFKAALTNTAPTATTDDEFADITEIAAGNGYTAGGLTLTSVTWQETGAGTGVWRWSFADGTWTASGGSIGPFRYIPVYSDTSTGDKLVGFWDYGASITITNGNSFTIDVDATNGVIQFSEA